MDCILIRDGSLFLYKNSVLDCVILKNGRVIQGNDVISLPDFGVTWQWVKYNLGVT
jgi:hypothetical protein